MKTVYIIHALTFPFNRYYCVYQWNSGSVNYHADFRPKNTYPTCGAYSNKGQEWGEKVIGCETTFDFQRAYTLCEDTEQAKNNMFTQLKSVQLSSANISSSRIRLTECPGRHSIELFLSCDPRSECTPNSESAATSSLCPSTLFTCEASREQVPYTLVCNQRRDCLDGTDETFCVYESYDESTYSECDDRKVLLCIYKGKKVVMILFWSLLCRLLSKQSSCLQEDCSHADRPITLMPKPIPYGSLDARSR